MEQIDGMGMGGFYCAYACATISLGWYIYHRLAHILPLYHNISVPVAVQSPVRTLDSTQTQIQIQTPIRRLNANIPNVIWTDCITNTVHACYTIRPAFSPPLVSWICSAVTRARVQHEISNHGWIVKSDSQSTTPRNSILLYKYRTCGMTESIWGSKRVAWLGDASRLSPSFCLCLSGHRKIWSLELLTGRTTSSKLVDTIHRIQPQAERKKVRKVTAACTRPHCWVSQEQRLQKQAEEAELSLKFNIDMPAHALQRESLFSRRIVG